MKTPNELPSSSIAVVGGGIVGSALAYYLATSPKIQQHIILIDRSITPLQGSTELAPGFVGQFNETEILARLAIDSVEEYLKIPGGFEVVGGLEVASTADGIERLKSRCTAAKSLGISAEIITAQEAVALAPEILTPKAVGAALYFPNDGAASAKTIAAFYQNGARDLGVEFLQSEVEEVLVEGGRVVGLQTSTGRIELGTVVLSTGIWTKELCKLLDLPIPIIPVAHPYAYGYPKTPPPRRTPWIRWPEHHVYARDHGSFYGVGSYDHKPIQVEPTETALGEWLPMFDDTLSRAQSFMANREDLEFRTKFNGIFAMTPDNLPLVGRVPSVQGFYMAAAVWVTQAAGSAKLLTRVLEGDAVEEDVLKALDPTRFKGQTWEQLKQVSLVRYNDIYATGGEV